MLFFFIVSALSTLDLSIKAAILFGSNNSFFSNSETCLTSLSIFSGFCLSSFIFSTFLGLSSGIGTASGLIFFTFFGGACSDTNFFSFSLIFSIIFFALGAYGILVLSVICINSTDTIGGRSIGFLAKKGKLKAVIIIKTRCDTEDIIILLFTSYLSLYGSDISATLVKPDPDNKPIISNTLP